MKYILTLLIFIFVINNHNVFANQSIYIDDILIAKQYAEENDKKLLMIFTADWCKYCEPLKNAIENNIERINKKYVVCYINFDTNKDLVKKYRVGSIPATIISNGNTITRIVGFSSFNTYSQKIGL
jgi:thioredoxin-related protein